MKKVTALTLFLLLILEGTAQQRLTFQDALQLAMYNNFNVLIARNDYKVAANENILGNAGFLPRVDGGIVQNNSILDTDLKFFNGEEVGADGAKSQSLNMFVQLNWTIFDGFNMFAAKARLEELEKAGGYEMLYRMEIVAAEIASVYYRLVQEQKFLGVLGQVLAISGDNLRLAETRFNLGSVSELERLNALVIRNQDSSAFLQQRLLIRNLKADLNILLGRDPDVLFELEEEITYAERMIFEDLKSDLAIQNNAALAARAMANASHKRIQEARSILYPQVNLFGAYNYNSQQNEVGVLQNIQSLGPNFGVNLSWTLFNGFNNVMEIKNRKLDFENAEYNRKQINLEINADLLKAYNNYEVWYELLALERLNLEVAHENVRIAKSSFDLGRINEIEFRVIQLIVLDAEFRLFTAEYQVRISEIELIRLSGRLAKLLSVI